MFTNFTEIQKELFWEVINELPFEFDDSKENDIEYLAMKIENNQPLNDNNLKFLRHSTLLLRLLKMVQTWESESNNDECIDEEKSKMRDKIVALLVQAEKREKNKTQNTDQL
jgi:hypothetical protein